MTDILRATFRRTLRLENRRRGVRAGRLEHLPPFRSALFEGERQLTVYLPPGYGQSPDRRYPVLYMQDGQNLFEPARAFVAGQHWRLRETADAAIAERRMEALIIVGIDHAGEKRISEYTPTPDPKHPGGGQADLYGRMLVEEIKPMIDARFLTRTGPADTAIGGSSLGGLVSFYLGLRHSETFGRVAAMSPSIWWNARVILEEADRFSGEPFRLWLDIGCREGAEALRDARLLRDRLLSRGWPSARFQFHEDRRGTHGERAWARRAGAMLEFLFPPA